MTARPCRCTAPYRLALLLVFLLPHAAAAQRAAVEGMIHDDTGRPVPGVHVFLKAAGRGTVTDVAGRFALRGLASGADTLVATAVGFRPRVRPVTLPAEGVVTVHLVLEEAVVTSDEVVVTAARRPQRAAVAPASLSLITSAELERRHATTLADVLRHVPGVYVAENQVNIRGSSGFSYNTGSRVLLLVDGAPLLGPDRESIPFEALPQAEIERIEVVKGPGSALYGSGALGGVVHVLTRPFPEQPETAVRTFGGAYLPVRHDTWREAWSGADVPRPFFGGSISHARRVSERLGFWASVAYREDRGYLRGAAETDVDAYAKFGYRPGAGTRMELLGGLTRRSGDNFLYWNGARDPLNPGRIDLVASDGPTGTNDTRGLRFSLLPAVYLTPTPRHLITLRARLFGAVIQPLDASGRPRPLDDGTVGFRYGLEGQVDLAPRSGRQITAGFSADALATTSSFFQDDAGRPTTRAQPEVALFLQGEERLGEGVTATAGVRYDAYWIDAARREARLSPKLALVYTPASWIGLRASYGRGFRVPGVAERFVNDRAFLPLVANPGLLPETSTGYEVGARLALRRPGGVTVDGALFWNDYRHLVEPAFVPEHRAFQFVNLVRARVRGLEASGEWMTRDARLHLRLAYTLLDARDLGAGTPLALRPRHLVQLSASTPLRRWLAFHADYRFTSRPERVDTDFARFVPDAGLILPVRVLDAGLEARRGAFRVGMTLRNALDYYYLERPALLAPPRHAVFRLQALF